MNTIDTVFFLRPLEPLFFGAPSPFNAGESHFSRSMFPPSPMTFQGILRSHLLRNADPPLNLDDWSEKASRKRADLVGESKQLPEGWQIKGPLPATLVEDNLCPWVPAPRFLFQNKKRGEAARGSIFQSGLPYMDDLGSSSADINFTGYGPPMEIGFIPAEGWVDAKTLWWALAGNDPVWPSGKEVLDLPPFLKNSQIQPGIALDREKNTASDGMLYRLEHLRFSAGSGFWGHFYGTLDDSLGQKPFSGGIGGAGRKGRLVAFEKPPAPVKPWGDLLAGRHIPENQKKTGCFWLYLLSPAAMEQPGKDDAIPFLPGQVRLNIRNLPRQVKLLEPGTSEKPRSGYIRCLCSVTGPPVILGGMDMAKGTTRANHSYIPAGSAWLLEIQGEDPRHLKDILFALNNTHLMGPPAEASFGFGHTLVGIGPDIKE